MEVVEFAEDLKREGGKMILDLGCGAGRHSILLGKQGFQVVALDISETALKTLDGRLKTASVDNVALVQHEMYDLPFIEGYFDGIICTNVLHHGKIVEIKRTAGEIRRVMREGASAGDERGIIHHFFSRSELESCFKGTKIVSFKERLIPVEEGRNRAHFLVTLKKPYALAAAPTG